MNGMRCEWWWAWDISGNFYSTSYHYELPPTPTIAELSMIQYYEFAGQAEMELGFTHVEYLDGAVTRHDDFSDIDAVDSVKIVARNGMSRIDWAMKVANCEVSHLLNLFFWDTVF